MNTQSKQSKSKTRMVHIRLPEDLHKRLRVRAAEADMSMQDWTTEAIIAKLDGKNEIIKT